MNHQEQAAAYLANLAKARRLWQFNDPGTMHPSWVKGLRESLGPEIMETSETEIIMRACAENSSRASMLAQLTGLRNSYQKYAEGSLGPQVSWLLVEDLQAKGYLSMPELEELKRRVGTAGRSFQKAGR